MTHRPFQDIVTEHGPTVLRVCRALLGPIEADDAWSETFLAAMRAYPDLRPGSNIEAWLVTIAHRKAIDQHRARARVGIPVGDLPEPLEHSIDGADGRWRDGTVWDGMRKLPRKQREAIAYHHLGGLPYAEVARILGNNEAAARRAAADGIKTLRRTLEPGASNEHS